MTGLRGRPATTDAGRDRQRLRALGELIDAAELGAASVVRIEVVRALLGRPRPERLAKGERR